MSDITAIVVVVSMLLGLGCYGLALVWKSRSTELKELGDDWFNLGWFTWLFDLFDD